MRTAGAVLAVAVTATGCPAVGSGQQSASAGRLALSATAVYGRHAAVRGKVDVRIANHGSEPVEVETYQVRHPQFDVLPAAERRSRLPDDGRARIVPIRFGSPRCHADDTGGAAVVLGVRTAAGTREVAVPLADGEPGLARVHRLACASAAVTQAASIELGPTWTPFAAGLRTTLRLTRRGAGAVVASELRGNVLFSARPAPVDPVVVLPAGARAAQADVVITASRCGAHALTESKTSFTFPLLAAVGGREPVPVPLTVTGVGRDALQDLLDRTCGGMLPPPG